MFKVILSTMLAIGAGGLTYAAADIAPASEVTDAVAPDDAGKGDKKDDKKGGKGKKGDKGKKGKKGDKGKGDDKGGDKGKKGPGKDSSEE